MIGYKDSGVDIEAGYRAVDLIKVHAGKTMRPGVINGIGGFGALFAPDLKGMSEPVLVSGTDGVGTKLKIAFAMDKHDTVGIDCVAMCVNDVVCSGAEPLFFLDYLALGKNVPERVAEIVSGVCEGCIQAGCALIGGETAEMPGFYPEDEYDIAGFVVGIVDRSKIIDGKRIKAGDKLIGIASSGLHSNGYSLVRKLLNLTRTSEQLREYVEALGSTLGEEVLKPTKIYVKTIKGLTSKFDIKGISNITGGGFYENIPRMIPEGLAAKINKGSWPVLPIFEFLKKLGDLDESCLYNTFNMGIGIVMAVDCEIADDVVSYLKDQNEGAYIIGEIVEGEAGVSLC